MELDELLDALDRAAANLAKLEAIWALAQPYIPTSPAAGSPDAYDDLCRSWTDLLTGLPPIDGWSVTDELPDIDGLGRGFIEFAEISEPPFPLWEEGEKPGKDLAEYRHRLDRARRRATRRRLEELVGLVDALIPLIVKGIPRDSLVEISGDFTLGVSRSINEIERLLADTSPRRGRWSDLHRHLHFGQGHDWHDINEFDWPSVKADISAGMESSNDPLPVPSWDLGEAASGQVTGQATTALQWSSLDDDGFERLLFDLLRSFPDYQNVSWLMKTRAPDRGRDLSLDRVLRTSTGETRLERVIVQAKHWLTRSVTAQDVAGTVAQTSLWSPPLVRGLIVATSGRFVSDAVAWAEAHNERGLAPYIDLWPESKLEVLLAQKSYIAVSHGLR